MRTSGLSPLLALFIGFAAVLPAAVETWTNMDGQKMQAEFLGRKGNFVTFKKEDGSRYLFPYSKLSPDDRARIDAIADAESPAADAPAAASPAAPAVPAVGGTVSAALAGKLVAVKGDRLAPAARDRLSGARYIALYHSAHWCPPCRAFTPDLVAAYKEIKAAHPEFELIFVSHDEDEVAMGGYMRQYGMEWPAVRFDQTKTARAVLRPANERGIPNLVFMDADGRELSVSYTPEGDYRGPRNVLADIKRHFKM